MAWTLTELAELAAPQGYLVIDNTIAAELQVLQAACDETSSPSWLVDLFTLTPEKAAYHAAYQAEIAAAEAAQRQREQQWTRDSQCPRCGGTGQLPQFMHRQNGMCFQCEGGGRIA